MAPDTSGAIRMRAECSRGGERRATALTASLVPVGPPGEAPGGRQWRPWPNQRSDLTTHACSPRVRRSPLPRPLTLASAATAHGASVTPRPVRPLQGRRILVGENRPASQHRSATEEPFTARRCTMPKTPADELLDFLTDVLGIALDPWQRRVLIGLAATQP